MRRTTRRRSHRLALHSECAWRTWSRTRGWPAGSGFTLLETLIALFVLSLLMSAVYGSYRAVTSSMADLQPRIALEQQGRFFVQRLSRQIRCCYGGRRDPAQRSAPDSQGPKPAASPEEETPFFRGGATMSDDALLQFATTSSALSRKSSLGCLALVSYKVDAWQHALLTCEEIYGRRGREEDQDWRVVLEDVQEVEFSYFDGVDWQSQWNSKLAGGLPRAVRISLVLQAPQESVPRCLTAVAAVPCSTLGKLQVEVPESPRPEAERKK